MDVSNMKTVLSEFKIDVNANRGSPTWKPPPNGHRDKWGSDCTGKFGVIFLIFIDEAQAA
jgi:hypothetical protein